MSALVGRARERRVLGELVDRVHELGGAVVVRGEAGIGKSALLAVIAGRAGDRGMVCLATWGVQSEAHLPFAGLHQLLHPFLGRLDGLPPPHRGALEAAFGLTEAAAPDLFLIALATLDLLGDAAAKCPLVLIADDAQWLDRATADVLVFVARRLSVDPIVLLVAVREGCEDPFGAAGLRELRVGPLDDEAARVLLDQHAADLVPAVRARVLGEAAGNPLALVELPLVIDSDVGEPMLLPDHLPLTARLERAFATRLSELAESTRVLLLVAAAADGAVVLPEVLAAATAVYGSEVTAAALGAAISRELVAVEGTNIGFRHPLVRSAIYQSASLDGRLMVHAALAEVLSGQPDRSVWHRAAATLGTDEGVAAELEAAAMRAQRRGATVVAVAALERAAELGERSPGRARRLLSAAELAFELGRPELAMPLLTKLESVELTVLQRGRMILIHELADPHPFEGAARCRWLVGTAQSAMVDGDVNLALDILWLVAFRCWWRDPGRDARRDITAALDRIQSAKDDPRVLSSLGYAAAEQRGGAVIDGLLRARSADELDPDATRLLGTAAIVTGAWDLAPAFLAASAAGLRAHGRLGQLPRVLVLQAMAAVRRADWNVALPAIDEARRLATETRQVIWAGAADAIAGLAAAMRGEEDQAEGLAADAERVVSPLGVTFVLASVQMARGAAALGAGRHVDAVAHLRRLFTVGDPAYHWTMRWWALADLVEAAVRAHQRELVEPLVTEFEPLAARTPAFWLRAVLRHARALLAEDRDAEALFQEALSADLQWWPFQRGRVLLGYGEWLRRRRRVAESRAPLRAAREAFDSVGARSWGERARQELRASGEPSRARPVATHDQLTAQELQIAQLAAAGMTNREIAAQLYLSHRTVGSHLYRIFPKLGITARAQLRAAVDGGTASPA
jgi:DNA-binding CsgD family transcriptional regulator